MSRTIAIIKGDGIGPEIMQATLRVLDALDCNLRYDFVEAGLEALQQHGQLMPPASIDTIAKHGIALKGPRPIGVVRGPLSAMPCLAIVSIEAGCISCPCCCNASRPASTKS